MRYVFNADGTLSLSLAGKTDTTTRYSAGCLAGPFTPAQACTNLQQSIAQEMGGVLDAGTSSFTLDKLECSMQADACVCEEVIDRSGSTMTGTYTTAGNQLVIAVASVPGAEETVDYCVSGNTLTIPTTSGDGYATFSR